jgi:hypothetical protein
LRFAAIHRLSGADLSWPPLSEQRSNPDCPQMERCRPGGVALARRLGVPEDPQFASRSIKVSGRGLSAWLGQPYEPVATNALANARTLSQAMEDLLPLGGRWTLDWAEGTPDWLLPAGSWSWANQAPIHTIHAAAQGVGLVVVPAMAAKVLTVQPRYPVLPWHFPDATSDLFVPDSARGVTIRCRGAMRSLPGTLPVGHVARASVRGARLPPRRRRDAHRRHHHRDRTGRVRDIMHTSLCY